MQLLFNLQRLSLDEYVRYAAFHLTGATHLWNIRLTKEVPMEDWGTFTRNLSRDFGPLIDHDTIGDLVPPRQDDSLRDYINTFKSYVTRIGINSELHQVHLFVNGHCDTLQAAKQ